jgi:signal transduction histidine kinase
MEEYSRDYVGKVRRAVGPLAGNVIGPVRSLVAVLAVLIGGTASAQNDAPHTSIASINLLPQTRDFLVTVRATLTLNGNPSYIQDATGGVAVNGLKVQGLRIGDELLLTGHLEDSQTGLAFRDSRAQLLWHGSPMPPLSVTADEAALGKFGSQLIEVSGRLVDTKIGNGETWLRLESGHQVFMARLNSEGSTSLLPHIDSDSILRLRGICSLQPRDTQYEGGFAVLLRSAEDVTVVSGPPWWSPKHLAELGFLLAGLVIAGHVALVQVLKGRFRAIIAERARLGHELHDTLAQSFAGLSYQIQAARKNVPASASPLAHHLDLALDMVRHSHSEAHRSIMMLRPQQLAEGADLHSAIQAALEESTAGCYLETRFTTKGLAASLPLIVTDTLYRVAQEAIANALRHGHPSRLDVNLDYLPTSINLSVTDNGIGFEAKSPQSRGFGLAGMRERIRALGGDFSVVSEPGKGAKISAEIHRPYNAGARLTSAFSAWASFNWDRLQRLLQR